MHLQRTLSDRYGSLRASVKTHFESLLDGLATELDGALRRDHAIEAWAIRADVAAALASNQDNLGDIQENLASGHVNLSNKALMASLTKYSRLLTLHHGRHLCAPVDNVF
ncbi:hypothetical protein AeMF1_003603 [Aphanomyces euteiches]|nr:hypothetical protein AeMF1_003603 [Aphanomyces euteiches]